jgi:hypothetical protein
LVTQLASLRILTHLDRAPLAAYCGAYAHWADATAAIKQYGTMVKSPTGYSVALRFDRKSSDRVDDAHRVGIWLYAGKSSRISTPSEREPTLFDQPERSARDGNEERRN